jgi:hypothetical protein
MLEIGVCLGRSLVMWSQFFPEAKLVGVDIVGDDKMEHPIPENATVERADQGNPKAMARIGATHGPFDVILDDGSHQSAHQLVSFRALFQQYLKPGGIYIVEDLECAYRGKYLKGASEPFTAFIAKLQDDMHPDHIDRRKFQMKPTPLIDSMYVGGGFVAIQRRDQ